MIPGLPESVTAMRLSPEELTALDDFRFKNRMPSRAAAVRELLKRGLAAEGFEAAAAVAVGVTEGGLGLFGDQFAEG